MKRFNSLDKVMDFASELVDDKGRAYNVWSGPLGYEVLLAGRKPVPPHVGDNVKALGCPYQLIAHIEP